MEIFAELQKIWRNTNKGCLNAHIVEKNYAKRLPKWNRLFGSWKAVMKMKVVNFLFN